MNVGVEEFIETLGDCITAPNAISKRQSRVLQSRCSFAMFPLETARPAPRSGPAAHPSGDRNRSAKNSRTDCLVQRIGKLCGASGVSVLQAGQTECEEACLQSCRFRLAPLLPPHLCRLSTATPVPTDEGSIIQRRRGQKRMRSLPSKPGPLDAHNAAGDGDEARDRRIFLITAIDGLVAIRLASFHFATLNLAEKNERQIASISSSHCHR